MFIPPCISDLHCHLDGVRRHRGHCTHEGKESYYGGVCCVWVAKWERVWRSNYKHVTTRKVRISDRFSLVEKTWITNDKIGG